MTGTQLPVPDDLGIELASSVIVIDLDAASANYRRLVELARPAECAAVVKADAYGLGVEFMAEVLWEAGCRTFFVATIEEGVELRQILFNATIYVLEGLIGDPSGFGTWHLRPVLNSVAEITEWSAYCHRIRVKLPAAIHIDSGMNRLGLSATDVEEIAGNTKLFATFELALVMSHLACADEPDHPKNAVQRDTFDRLRAKLPESLVSLANSAGVLLGSTYHYDLVRPGIAIYGGNPRGDAPNPFRPVAHVYGRIAQTRSVNPGETVGYGATRTFRRPSRLATVVVGYADGLFRALSRGDDDAEGLHVHIGDHTAPIVGRVSMDLITIDVTDIPETLAARGAWVEIMGPNVTAQDHARHAGTIDYEILTNLGRRALRRYIRG